MKSLVFLHLAFACLTAALHAEIIAGRYDMAQVRDVTSTFPDKSGPLRHTGPAIFAGEATLPVKPDTIDLVTVHQYAASGSTLTFSSPLLRATIRR